MTKKMAIAEAFELVDGRPHVIGNMVRDIILYSLKRIRYYANPRLTVTATVRSKYSRQSRNLDIALTLGRPNYAAQKRIIKFQKEGFGFPIFDRYSGQGTKKK